MNGLRRNTSFEFFEPSEFIGAWSARNDCYRTRLPLRRRTETPARLSAFADAALALSAVAVIFSIPLLIMFVTVH